MRERGKKVLEKRGKGMVLLENIWCCFLGESESVRGKVKGCLSVRSSSCEYDGYIFNSVSVFCEKHISCISLTFLNLKSYISLFCTHLFIIQWKLYFLNSTSKNNAN